MQLAMRQSCGLELQLTGAAREMSAGQGQVRGQQDVDRRGYEYRGKSRKICWTVTQWWLGQCKWHGLGEALKLRVSWNRQSGN